MFLREQVFFVCLHSYLVLLCEFIHFADMDEPAFFKETVGIAVVFSGFQINFPNSL